MRIGVDAFNLAADRRGMGRVVRLLLSQLRNQPGVEVVLIARDAARAQTLQREFDFEAVASAALRRTPFDAIWYPWNGMRFRPHAPAIVTVYDPFAFTFPASSLVARWREQSPIRRAIQAADTILTVSHWTASEVTRLFGGSQLQIRVLPPALDPYWKPVAAQPAAPYVLFVAGTDRRKNASMLFRAFADAAPALPQTKLVVAGSLNERDEQLLRSLQAPFERARPDDDELRRLYSGALAVAVPSIAEGFGLPAIEAMACGAPVIAADASALPEACAGASMLVPAEDERAWSRALVRIVDDEALRHSMRERGLRRVASIDPLGAVNVLLECVRRFRADAR